MSEDQAEDGLAATLLNTLGKYKMVPDTSDKKVIMQSYNGAATMSSKLNGAQAKMQRNFL